MNNTDYLHEDKERKIIFRDVITDIPSTTYATFGLYRYPAKFIPQAIAYILKNYGKKGMSVFDPFGGYGTTGLVSRIYGMDYELWDLNPIIEILHKIAIMRSFSIDIESLIRSMKTFKSKFIPDWSRMDYWFDEDILSFLHDIWGFYHSLEDQQIKLLLTIPLLRVTRYFSYDDSQRQKLSQSDRSKEKIKKIITGDAKKLFFSMLLKDITKILVGVNEYQKMNPKNVDSVVSGGVDVRTQSLSKERNILLTSPPYLQSQEYIRYAKLDLFWLGYSESLVQELGKKEIPYAKENPYPVLSNTFEKHLKHLDGENAQVVFQRYFWSILGCFTRLQESISDYMFIFVGDSSIRGRAVPIDKIIIEHFSELGWNHEETLVDTIVSRRLFSYKQNPASGLTDQRTSVENMIVFKKA